MKKIIGFLLLGVILLMDTNLIFSQPEFSKKFNTGFDQYMEKIIKDWNIAGAAIGIVYKDKLVFAKGYGYRDYDKKLPVTPNSLFQIASNTKLFTTISVGMMVDEGKLDWDKPVRNYVPSLQFFNDDLNRSVTIRDMLAHRTGISRHDWIWTKSDFSRKDLFERVKYLEPSQPIRQSLLYNNLMYVSAGYIVELLSNRTWEDFLKVNVLDPLEMKRTFFTVDEMEMDPDHAVPFNEKRDTTILYRIPIYEDQQAVGPAGCIISNVNDMSHWLIALMNGGRYNNKQVIPEKVLNETLEPSIAVPNTSLKEKGYKELLNTTYGMGRFTASYKGHFLADHGGDLPGFHSQVSCMPYDSLGVIVFVIGDHGAPLYDIITYNIYDRLLRLEQTPWSERILKDVKESKALNRTGRNKSGADRIPGTKPSHNLLDYTGAFENEAYGIVNISKGDTSLAFDFHGLKMPLQHYHYDRFDSPNDEEWGLFSFNFLTNPQGEIDALKISIDEGQIVFSRKVDETLKDPEVMAKYTGKYDIGGTILKVELIDKKLYVILPGLPKFNLLPIKPDVFRISEFTDVRVEFVKENGSVTGIKQTDPSGQYYYRKVL